MSLLTHSIAQIQDGLRRKVFSAVDVTNAYLERIESVDATVHAYLLVDAHGALAQARAIDKQLAAGESVGPLAGVPVSLKDLFCTKGLTTTASSHVLKTYVPPYDATVVKRLKEAGAVMLGKVNLDAFAHGSSTETSDMGPSKHPLDHARHPGGSSGGSTASVGSFQALVSMGTETSGSIRMPAALTGLVGLKPTYGRVSRYGVIAMASSLDCPGPIARTVLDAATVFDVVSGHDPYDATSIPTPVGDVLHELSLVRATGLKGLTIGIPKEGLMGSGAYGSIPSRLPEAMQTVLQEAVEHLVSLGADVKEVSVPSAQLADAVYAVICPSEVSSNLMRYDGVHYGVSAETLRDGVALDAVTDLDSVYTVTRGTAMGQEAKRRIMTGTYALSAGYFDAYYKKAAQVRTNIRKEFDAVFSEVDLLIASGAPFVAPRLGAAADDPTYGYTAEDPMTFASSLAGLPGISIPVGLAVPSDADAGSIAATHGLPVGLQCMAAQKNDLLVLRVAQELERSLEDAPWRSVLTSVLEH